MVDKPKLDQMLTNLGRYLVALRRLGSVPRSEFVANVDQVGSAKYHLVIASGRCIDVANHVIASEGFRFPKDNTDSFTVLVEHGVIDASGLDALRAMARFRTRLVHLYWEVDDERVHEYLRDSLGDLEGFGRAIGSRSW